jgi:glycosyltransferase involved in cell wall biosynthesis
MPGGIGNHAYGLFLSLEQSGKEVRVLTNSRDALGEEQWLKEHQLKKKVLFVPRLKPTIRTYVRRWMSLRKSIRSISGRGAVLIFSGKFSIWMLALSRIPDRIQCIAVIHGTEIRQSGFGKQLFQLGLQKAKTIISVSSHTQQKLLEAYPLTDFKCRVINNGFIAPEALPKRNRSLKPVYLITLGNLSRRKGQVNVIRALPEIIKSLPNIHYRMLGLPTEKEWMLKTAHDLGVEEHIGIIGAVDESTKWKMLAESSIFLMLSENLPNGDFEGFGIAILEANYMGVPAIGSRDTGIADAINHGYSGFLVDPHNPVEIAEAIQKIMADYDGFSQRAKEHAEKFRWERKVGEYLEVISDRRPQTADR